jgi:hypothetical protein
LVANDSLSKNQAKISKNNSGKPKGNPKTNKTE